MSKSQTTFNLTNWQQFNTPTLLPNTLDKAPVPPPKSKPDTCPSAKSKAIHRYPMNPNYPDDSLSAIELSIAQERLRQARRSFNLALVVTATSAVISFAGVGLVLLGKAPEGTITAIGGLASTAYCLKLSKEANDRLDKLSDHDDRLSPSNS